jgi:hypothetical protein
MQSVAVSHFKLAMAAVINISLFPAGGGQRSPGGLPVEASPPGPLSVTGEGEAPFLLFLSTRSIRTSSALTSPALLSPRERRENSKALL